MKRILTNPHCTAGTLGHHCTPGTLGFHHGTMGLTNQESATINQVAGQLNAASQMHKGQAQKLRNLGYANFGNSISGKVVGTVVTGAVIGNTLVAKTLGMKWIDALDLGFITTGLASALAGGFTIANGIPEEDVTKLAAGGALMGLGLFYIGAGK